MPNFMIAYHGGSKPGSKEEGQARMERWKNWIEGLGESMVNPGTPLPASKIITPAGVEDDNDSNSMNGFAIIKADNIEAAVQIAKPDSFLDMGGKIRVSRMMEMP
jgi:hypothetical protein